MIGRLASLLAVGLLLTALTLGLLASTGKVDSNLHASVAVVAAALATVGHVRGGSGWDFIAVVSLIAAVDLGLLVQGGAVPSRLHLVLAVAAVGLSSAVHFTHAIGPGGGKRIASVNRKGT